MTNYIPEFLPYYEKALPEVLPNYAPVSEAADMNVTSVDFAGNNYSEPSTSNIRKMFDSIDAYKEFMKTQNSWSYGDSMTLNDELDKYISENLTECRNDTSKKTNNKENQPEVSMVEPNLVIHEDEGDDELSVDNAGQHKKDIVTEPDLDAIVDDYSPRGTPINKRIVLQGLDNAPRRTLIERSKFYQRPRTMFEEKENKCAADWENKYHIGNEKYVTVSQFRGRKTVHIRQFYMDKNNKRRPTKTGLVLLPEEWKTLTNVMKSVNTDLES